MVDSNLRDLIDSSSNQTQPEVIDILINSTKDRKIELIKLLIQTKSDQYIEIMREIMLFEDDSSVRAFSFYFNSLFGKKDIAEDLLEALALENNHDVKQSMLDIFKIYCKKHRITLDNIDIKGGEENQDEIPNIIELEQISNQYIEYQDNVSDKNIDHIKNRIIYYIHEMTTDIPISLHRLSQILNIEPKLLENYLIKFAKENPDAATYLKFEQVFIKTPVTIKTLLDNENTLRKINCKECGELTSSYPCDKCEKGLQCTTCRLIIGNNDQILYCPNCNQPSHKSHILEWLKIKGNCPNCKEMIRSEELLVIN